MKFARLALSIDDDLISIISPNWHMHLQLPLGFPRSSHVNDTPAIVEPLLFEAQTRCTFRLKEFAAVWLLREGLLNMFL